MDIYDTLLLLHQKEAELKLLDYGAVEVRERNNSKYIYTHFKEDGENQTMYIGEYTDDEYNKAISRNTKAKALKKDIRKLKRKVESYDYQKLELSQSVVANIVYARHSLSKTIYKQAILEGISTTEIETENIIEGLKVHNMTAPDILKIVNLKHAWDFILDEYVISKQTNYSILCVISKLVLEGFIPFAGKLRDVPVSISGTDWKPDFPFEADIKDDINNIVNSNDDDVIKSINLLLYVSRKQMFLDGNKRCAVIFANHYLISKGKGLIVVPDDKVSEYKKLLIEFYETNNKEKITEFLKKCYTNIKGR